MNWLLGIFAFGVFVIALLLFRQQLKSEREFMDWLEKNCGGTWPRD